MGLKCSVLGHKYGDTTVERDREEQGSEVVITIQEIETCQRCGSDRVVSENKEVTSIATPDDPEPADERARAADSGDEDDVPSDDSDDEAIEEPAASAEGGVEEPVSDEASESGTQSADESPGTDAPEPDEGAEILDAESDVPVADDELADPSIDDESEAVETTEEDAVIMGRDDEDADDGGRARAPGEWPEEPGDDEGEDWSPTDVVGGNEPTITAPDAGTEENGAVTVPNGDFVCPECGYTTAVEASSLRAGDFCPECRKGALVHRPEDPSDDE